MGSEKEWVKLRNNWMISLSDTLESTELDQGIKQVPSKHSHKDN